MNQLVLLILHVTIVENKDTLRLSVQNLTKARTKVVTRNKKTNPKRNVHI